MPAQQRLTSAVASLARRSRQGRPPSTDKVYFLAVTIDGVAGVPRTVLTLAAALADRHDVEIISVYRRRDEPSYPVDPRVKVTYLYDQRKASSANGWVRARSDRQRSWLKAGLDSRPSAFLPHEKELSALTDALLVRHLPRLEPGVLVSVRPALHAAVAELAPRHLLTIAQDHLNFPIRMRNPEVAALMGRVTERLDALAALTMADAVDYRNEFPDAQALITSIPNAASWPPVDSPPPLEQKVVVSGGRLERRKGFHRLVEAYVPVARKHPDWQLHIYGKGPEEAKLAAQIDRLGVADQILLKGYATDFRAALSGASVYAMASVYEGFPMVLPEAMSRGLPLVSYDCPRGPAEIIDDGRNGRLVPDGDRDGLSAALLQLVEDDELRRSMGREALDDVRKYGIDAIAERWEELFAQLLARRGF